MITTTANSHLSVNRLSSTIAASTRLDAMAAGKFLPAFDPVGWADNSDLEKLGFFVLQDLINMLNVLVRDVIQLLLSTPHIVFAGIAVFLQFV